MACSAEQAGTTAPYGPAETQRKEGAAPCSSVLIRPGLGCWVQRYSFSSWQAAPSCSSETLWRGWTLVAWNLAPKGRAGASLGERMSAWSAGSPGACGPRPASVRCVANAQATAAFFNNDTF